MRGPRGLLPALLAATLALAACDTAAERAEEHYQNGMALLEAGDVDRAMVEFRNVFRLNGDHTPARQEYARLLVERGQLEEAFGQYLRLVEQDWDSVEGHKRLAGLALQVQDFEAAATHAEAAYRLDADDPEIRALKATADFRDEEPEAAAEMARGVLEELPGSIPAHMVLVAERMQAGDPEAALAQVDAALGHAPGDEGLHLARLGVLERLGDTAAVGDQLTRMAELFPGNDGIHRALVRWHLGQGDVDAAEALMRELAAGTPDDPQANLDVVRFLLETRGPAAARAELERLIESRPDPAPFRRALAGLDFAAGRTEAAVAAMRGLIEASEPSDERRDSQVALARMLDRAGDAAGRDALVEAVLAEDPSHVEALKLEARRQIDADMPDAAIRGLRTALNQAPQDPELLTLMAAAHQREGSRELAGERLALAVEASNRGAAESIRYAGFLMQEDRPGPAEAVINDALRRDPRNPELLMTLGRIHLQRRDLAQAREAAARLRARGDPAAERLAIALEAEVLRAEDRRGEAIDSLAELAGEAGEDVRAMAGVVETYVEAEDLSGARTYLDDILAAEPGNLPARLMRANLELIGGEPDAAEAAYRELIADAPGFARAHQALVTLLSAQGRGDAAAAAIEAGLAATGGDPGLRFARAGLLEARGDVAGAIAVYEELYAEDSASPVIANNLASLLASHRDDPESLERAFAIARRLRGTEVPQFQDTYGWILSRRGEHEAALGYLEDAAAALPGDPLVQFHLGMTLRALGRHDAARAALGRAVAAAGDTALPQIAEARQILAEPAPAAPAAD